MEHTVPAASIASPRPRVTRRYGAAADPGDSERRPREPAQLGIGAASGRDQHAPARPGQRGRGRPLCARADSAPGAAVGTPLPAPLPGQARPGRPAAGHCRGPGGPRFSGPASARRWRSGFRRGRQPGALRRIRGPSPQDDRLARPADQGRRPSGVKPDDAVSARRLAERIDSSRDSTAGPRRARPRPGRARGRGASARSSSSKLLASTPPDSGRPAAFARSRRAGNDISPSAPGSATGPRLAPSDTPAALSWSPSRARAGATPCSAGAHRRAAGAAQAQRGQRR